MGEAVQKFGIPSARGPEEAMLAVGVNPPPEINYTLDRRYLSVWAWHMYFSEHDHIAKSPQRVDAKAIWLRLRTNSCAAQDSFLLQGSGFCTIKIF